MTLGSMMDKPQSSPPRGIEGKSNTTKKQMHCWNCATLLGGGGATQSLSVYKRNVTKFSNYRTVALISHASKMTMTFITDFPLPKIAEEQCGSAPGKGPREEILNVRQIV